MLTVFATTVYARRMGRKLPPMAGQRLLAIDGETKRCSKCREHKNVRDFNRHKKSPDGLYSQCRACAQKLHRSESTSFRPDRTESLVGRRFGRYVVEDFAFYDSLSRARWHCVCECGNRTTVLDFSLRSGQATQCIACARQARRLEPNKSARNWLIYRYRHGAKKRGIQFGLSEEEFFRLIKGNCHYCGKEPVAVSRGRSSGHCVYNGIDRVDSLLGYTTGNVVPCCKQCNISKRDLPLEEFKAWIDRAFYHQHRNDSTSNVA